MNVQQKVPLNFDRDNVRPSYLSRIHALVLEATKTQLTAEDVNQSWVKVAVQERGGDLSNETVTRIADLRFGAKRVVYDPSADAILPAGQVTPSRPGTSIPRVVVSEEEWTPSMKALAELCTATAPHVIGVKVKVEFFNNPTVGAVATYGARTISFNVGRLGRKWFFESSMAKILSVVVHEFAHEVSGNHLSQEYYDALTDIGAKMVALALGDSSIFNRYLETSGVILA